MHLSVDARARMSRKIPIKAPEAANTWDTENGNMKGELEQFVGGTIVWLGTVGLKKGKWRRGGWESGSVFIFGSGFSTGSGGGSSSPLTIPGVGSGPSVSSEVEMGTLVGTLVGRLSGVATPIWLPYGDGRGTAKESSGSIS